MSRADHLTPDLLSLQARGTEQMLPHDLTIQRPHTPCQLSVIMTCYRFLQRLRLSLRNWCHQTLAPSSYEVLVVNPESPDGTHEYLATVARSYPELAICEVAVEASLATNKGAMINRAVNASRGTWIWLTDADCLFSPTAAAGVLGHVQDRPQRLFYGRRRHLTTAHTDALLSSRIDGLHDFEALTHLNDSRIPDNEPWGYTQIVHRSTFERVRYREDMENYVSDGLFIEECKRLAILPEQIDGLYCFHLVHPFAWYGTTRFL